MQKILLFAQFFMLKEVLIQFWITTSYYFCLLSSMLHISSSISIYSDKNNQRWWSQLGKFTSETLNFRIFLNFETERLVKIGKWETGIMWWVLENFAIFSRSNFFPVVNRPTVIILSKVGAVKGKWNIKGTQKTIK